MSGVGGLPVRSMNVHSFASFYACRSAASLLVDECERFGAQVVALGTGQIIEDVLGEIARRNLSISCVPTSDATAAEAAIHGVPISPLDDKNLKIDVMIDVADEIDVSYNGFAYIVGRGENGIQAGQASLRKLKDVMARAIKFFVFADEENASAYRLRGDVPVS